MTTPMSEPKPNSSAIRQLVRSFAASESTYSSPAGKYQEAEVRSEFIDPLLEAFGWDTTNRAGVAAAFRPVLREESQQRDNSHAKKPDYTLRDGHKGLVYVEAKKPAVNILRDMESILQARAYGYTDRHPIVVLTNFRDLSVYDTSSPAMENDQPETCRLYTWHFTEYEACQAEIAAIIGQNKVTHPDWDRQFTATRPAQAIPADQAFVRQINVWRGQIGANIVENHPQISAALLNDVVQRLINRLIFVRMCEDRGIEGEAILREAAAGQSTNIEELFKRLNRRYNSGLFDQSNAHAEPIPLLDANLLTGIIDSLYSPRSPFSFAVLDADFLGLVYETSLSEQLEIVQDGNSKTVRLTEKPEYAKRDVVTTPQELVRATVEEAWKSVPTDASRHPKVLDFAVGSGRFLLSAFNQYLSFWTQHLTGGRSSDLIKTGPEEWRLTFEAKCRILKESYFGIDVDYNAVEVARFSLLVRLLEDETLGTLPSGTRILPNLDENIVHGNTLIRTLPEASDAERALAVPLDLGRTKLPKKFDLIVGNPPYMQTKEMKSFNFAEYSYLKSNYELLHQQFDKYFAFLEFALGNTTDTGVVSVVVPNKWMTNVAGKKLRERLASERLVATLVNFRHNQLFEGKTIYVCALTMARGDKDAFEYSEPASIFEFTAGRSQVHRIPYGPQSVNSSAWVLPANDFESSVLRALASGSIPLSRVAQIKNGIQTSKNKTYILTDWAFSNGEVSFVKAGKKWTIEEAVTRPYLEDSLPVKSYHSLVPDARVIYPYRAADLATNPSGFEIIPMEDMRKSYPKAYEYLAEHEAGMSDRDMGNAMHDAPFYAYGRVQAIGSAVVAPKILYSVNQTGKKYALDETGIVFSSGGTAGEVALYPNGSGYSLDFVLALLDQAPIEFYLRKRGSPFRGGYVARGSDVMEEVPVPKLDFGDERDRQFHERVSNSMEKLRRLTMATVAPRDLGQHRNAKAALKSELDTHFAQRWGLDVTDYGQLGVHD
jgi:hypothetical protein